MTSSDKGITIKTRDTCRNCGSKSLVPILSLGEIYVIDFGEKGAHKAPLELVLCNPESGCGLLQLKHTVSQDALFRHYYYKSGVNLTMTAALAEIVQSAIERVNLRENDLVIDIGCNDGTLLRAYPRTVRRLGFEPARNLVEEAKKGGNMVVNDFFSAENCPERNARIITAISMFYDLEDPNSFLEDVRQCLAPDGVVIIQQNYLVTMLEKTGFDNIVNEHVAYYSLSSLNKLLQRHNLVIEDVEFNNLNGGSFRVYVRHRDYTQLRVRASVGETLERERALRLDRVEKYKEFAKSVEETKMKLQKFISSEVRSGKRVYGYGASTRGNTLLQVCGLDSKLIRYAVERNPAKWGTRMGGSNIPVISEEEARKDPPDYFLILPWHFLSEFVEREWMYLVGGGRFIVPLPVPSVLEVKKL